MSETAKLDSQAEAALHNRLVEQVVSQLIDEPLAAGGTMSLVMTAYESVILGVLERCFKRGDDLKILDAVVGRVKARLENAMPVGTA